MDEYLNQVNQPQESPVLLQDDEAVVKTAKKAYSRSLLNLVMYGIIGELLVIILVAVCGSRYDSMSMNVKYLINFLPMYFIAFPIYLLLSKPMEKLPPEKHSMKFGQFLIAFMMSEGIAITGSLIGTFLTTFLTLLFHIDTSSSLLEDGVLGEGQLVFSVMAVLFAPVIEELLFRKVLIDRIRKYGDGTAILISGIFFGLFHGNLTQFFYAAGLGMLFAFIYVRTGKVQYTIGLHMCINFLGSVVSAFVLKNIDLDSIVEALESMNIDALFAQMSSLVPLFIYEIIIYSVAIAGVVLLIVNRKKFRVAPPTVAIQKGKHAKAAWVNFGVIAMLVYCVLLFIFQIISQMSE